MTDPHHTPIRAARLVLAASLAVALTVPALAEDNAPNSTAPAPEISEGAELLSEGMRLLFKGLLAQGEAGWSEMIDWLDDLSAYEPPERLPNGDILIRRRPPAPGEEPGDEGDGEGDGATATDL